MDDSDMCHSRISAHFPDSLFLLFLRYSWSDSINLTPRKQNCNLELKYMKDKRSTGAKIIRGSNYYWVFFFSNVGTFVPI